ncbi:hypothetical protein DMI65_24465 [Escherichia coli]|nr:hypothetical protein [Escherichia coli]
MLTIFTRVTMYSETRNMTPFGDSDYVVANKTQNFEVTAQYQFDFWSASGSCVFS